MIPMDLMLQMPLSFVHRLRDLRIKQLNEESKRLQSKNMTTPPNQPNAPNDQNPIYPFGASSDFMEDLVDELT